MTSFVLVGCGTNVKEVETVSEATEKTPLDVKPANSVSVDPVNWRIVTPDNIEEVLREVQEKGGQPVLFALTESGYKQLSLDLAEIRNHINTQRRILLQYQQYYEGSEEPSPSE